MARGQQESAFQWIYVLIAGAAFLFLFFIIFKSCAGSAETKLSAGTFDSGINSLSSAIWQREATTSILFPASNVSCPAGTLTINDGKNIKSIDRLPIFLSPTIGKTTYVLTKDIFSPAGMAPLPLGSIGYVVDSQVKYYIFDDGNSNGNANANVNNGNALYAQNIISIIKDSNLASNFILVKRSDFMTLMNKQTSGTAVLIMFKSGHHVDADLPLNLPNGTIFLYVNTSANSNTVTYFENQNNTWISQGKVDYTNDKNRYFLLGAIISAKRQNYECSKSAIVDRMEKITNVYMLRSDILRNSSSALISNSCKLLHNGTFSYLNSTNYQLMQGNKNSYLQRLLVSSNLTNYQEIMTYTTDCPVVS